MHRWTTPCRRRRAPHDRARMDRTASAGAADPRPTRPRPVCVTVTQDAAGWLIDVTDAAPGHRPAPVVGRDPAHGGMGLYPVARLSAAHGCWIARGRKHVWAHVRAAS